MRRFIVGLRRGSLIGLLAILLVPAVAPAAIVEFPVRGDPTDIVAGRDKALWFTEPNGNKIGRLTTAGRFREFGLPTARSAPLGITAGPDGALWFTESFGGKIGRITAAGKIKEFALPNPDCRSLSLRCGSAHPITITAGPDGGLWFIEVVPGASCLISPCGVARSGEIRIGRITTTGSISEFPIPTPPAFDGNAFSFQPEGITVGPDRALWFADTNGDKIGRVTTAGNVSEFPVAPESEPESVTSGPDRALWFTERNADKIGRLTTGGSFREFRTPTAKSVVTGITAGPDRALWFTEHGAGKIGRITTAGRFSEFPVPTRGGLLSGITVGPDRALWFTDGRLHAGKIGRITTPGQKKSCSGLKARALKRCRLETRKQALARCRRISKKRRAACLKRARNATASRS
jgi:virginiamycin B lyase